MSAMALIGYCFWADDSWPTLLLIANFSVALTTRLFAVVSILIADAFLDLLCFFSSTALQEGQVNS